MEAGFSTPAQNYYEIMEHQTQSLGNRDLYTVCHSLRMARTSYFVAYHLGPSSNQCKRVHSAASAHDIGKIGVLGMILQRNESLVTRGQAIMKQHPALGTGILMQSASTEEIVYTVWCHHEHYDGTGYPNTLCDGQIPLEARIIVVCGSFSAMRNRRAYRDPLPDQTYRNEIKKNIGTMYGPAIAKLVLRNWQTMQKLRSAKQ